MFPTQAEINGCIISTCIKALGRSSVESPLPSANFIESEHVPLFLDEEHIEELRGHSPVPLSFEQAGPRKFLYFDTAKTKCAIVTCGGLCPGVNDVIRAIVMACHHHYQVPAVLGIRYGLEGFIPKYGHEIEELTPDKVTDIHNFGGTILGSSRGPQSEAEIVDALERLNISVLFLIGGDGTMKAMNSISKEIQGRNLRISLVGIPKTIDNDINFITQSFGFETAVFKATEAISCAHTEAVGFKNCIGIVKLMGRESGFIAAHATMALKEVNFLLIPEIPFAMEGPGGLLEAIGNRLKTRRHVVIVAAEGAGQHLMEHVGDTDPSGNKVLGDVAELLRRDIKRHFKERSIPVTIKTIDPSYIIRSIPANANDRVYCGLLGQNAVHAAMAGRTDMVVAKLMDRYVHLPLSLIIRKRRKLNIHSQYWRSVLESTGQPPLATINGG